MSPLVQTLIDILKIPSVTCNEQELAKYVEERIKKSTPKLRTVRIGDSLIVFGDKKPGQKTIALAGHLDTVPGDKNGEDSGNGVRVDGDKVIGLGASDMKAGVAIMLELLTEELFSKSPYNLIFIFYAREEGPNRANELWQVIPALPELKEIDLAFFLEPTDGELHLGACSSMGCEVTIPGVRAHSARPWQGVNAISKASELVSKIAALPPKEVVISGLTFKEVLSVTKINAGIAPNVIPDSCYLYLNARGAPGTTEEATKKWVTSLLPSDAVAKFSDWNPTGNVPKNNPIFEDFRSLYKLPEHPKQAYTDVALFSVFGIEGINFGPGFTAQAHQKGEFVSLELLNKVFSVYREFLVRNPNR